MGNSDNGISGPGQVQQLVVAETEHPEGRAQLSGQSTGLVQHQTREELMPPQNECRVRTSNRPSRFMSFDGAE
ncbi:hypothetical protein DPMN_185064 [Dreissena polymorpha]|uniref:Uncharacterized protein n=1 Tax=Dreissena polymorpha TaxID=45954 RepID=A0A9D4I8E6_DREPO|nr:hypothetical protein DPMN_185064 [Dreissena polymorpha]